MIKNNFEESLQPLLPKDSVDPPVPRCLHQMGVREKEEEMNSQVLVHLAFCFADFHLVGPGTHSGCTQASFFPRLAHH